MISHIYIGVRNFDAALKFYMTVLPEIGWKHRFTDTSRPWAAWQPLDRDRPLLLVGSPFNGDLASPGNGQMVALLAPTRGHVDRFFAQAIAKGGVDDGPPGIRTQYHPNYYGAYVRDLDGNKICVCCHGPE
jgi:catechol 2,3-dioxygenase-like lactoylglutathione lyase family enzyme